METSDFVVVGAGVTGASVAYRLAQHGRVILLEQETQPGRHATGRSAATFTEGYGGGAVRRLTQASRAFFESSTEQAGFGEVSVTTPQRMLHVAGAGRGHALAARADAMRAQGTPCQMGDGAAAVAASPILRQGWVEACLEEPGALDIDVDLLLQGFLRGLRARGGEIVLDAAVTAASRHGDRWRVLTAGRDISCAVVINAAGAWADEVAERSGMQRVGLQPLRRTAILIASPPGVNLKGTALVLDVDEQFYFKPDAGQLLCSPCDETPMPPHDAYAEEYEIAVAAERLMAATTVEVTRVNSSWAGLRTFAPDRNLVLGAEPEHPGFFWAAGQGGYGVQTAPAASRLLEGLIVAGAAPEDITAFDIDVAGLSPQRFRAA
jgi:D-arginine dehydrogenase